jgi:hypothetical protein
MVTIYGIKNCETMKNARRWLDSHKVEHNFHDYKVAGIDKATLEGWVIHDPRAHFVGGDDDVRAGRRLPVAERRDEPPGRRRDTDVRQRAGAVVGVVSSKLNALKVVKATGDLPQNINFAIKTGAMRDFLDNSVVPYKTAEPKTELKTAEIARLARAYTMLISCNAKQDK